MFTDLNNHSRLNIQEVLPGFTHLWWLDSKTVLQKV